MSNARYITRAEGGDWCGSFGLIPGPGHRPFDRSVKVWDGDDGRPMFHSFATKNPVGWRDLQAWAEAQGYVEPWKPGHRRDYIPRPRPNPAKLEAARQAEAEQSRKWAWGIWNRAGDTAGTIAEPYWHEIRLISQPMPRTIRFHPRLRHGWTDTHWPGLVCAVQGVDGKFRGIVRILINPETADKAPVTPNKPTLGPCSGGAVRLAAPEGGRLCIGEGVESTASAMELSGWPAWAAVTAPFMEALELPPDVREVTIAADNDKSERGQLAARHASRRWIHEGRTVRIALPEHPGTDWNDELQDMKNSERSAAA